MKEQHSWQHCNFAPPFTSSRLISPLSPLPLKFGLALIGAGELSSRRGGRRRQFVSCFSLPPLVRGWGHAALVKRREESANDKEGSIQGRREKGRARANLGWELIRLLKGICPQLGE